MMLASLIERAERRIAELRSGERPALVPDANAKYVAEVTVNLDEIDEPMVADPDEKIWIHQNDIPMIRSGRYLFYKAEKKVDLGFVDPAWFTREI